jgi:hypothetical protein
MTRETRLTVLSAVPVFALVVLAARALWLAHVATLNESELHLRVFDHPLRIAVTFWGTCLIVSAAIARLVALVVVRVGRHGKRELSNER